MNYISRDCEPIAGDISSSFASFLVTGARQVGKSTLLKHIFSGSEEIRLDLPLERARITQDSSVLQPQDHPILLEEVQKLPEIFEVLKAYIDREPHRKSLYALTGSEQFGLMRGVRDSLAGRIAILTLYPLSVHELRQAGKIGTTRMDLWRIMLKGGYPAIWSDTLMQPALWMRGYLNTYLERDIEGHFGVQRLSDFVRFLELLALRAGQLLNISELARDARVSDVTARDWLSLLERSYIISLVRPWHSNHSKRLVKMPKLYFLDTGLLCYLCGIDSEAVLERHPMRGECFENLVYCELLKTLSLNPLLGRIYFYRTHDGTEVDFIVERGLMKLGIEVKLSEPTRSTARRHLKAILDQQLVQKTLLIHGGDQLSASGLSNIREIAWWQIHEELVRALQSAL